MPALDRRTFLMLLMSEILALAATPPVLAKDDKGGGNDGNHGGKGGGNNGNHGGKGGKGNDDKGDDDGNGDDDDDDGGDDDGDADDDEDRAAASKAVREGRATPLRELLKVVRRRYPGEVVDVRLQRRRGNLLYRVKILDRRGRMINVGIDARTRLIVPSGGL